MSEFADRYIEEPNLRSVTVKDKGKYKIYECESPLSELENAKILFNNGNNGDAAMFFDEKGFYYSKFYTPRDNRDAVQNRFNIPVIYLGRNFIFTRNAFYSKSSGTVLSYSPKYWHSAHVNAKNQVFLLDQDQKILRKYNSIDEVPKK
ncbi:hypothetical protein [Bacillus sp. CECT 9360]|uniref:hypothetical protein n=1 Tax=Bacillus sp. CECT 9360 TaxID=2845821 RepID=UPI001E4F057B|nr:hypothetical protein [Bacillus sp. CECT 9360]CAH0346268.1 hypothetical protein BCI9360_02595 [Bacillus sp. CECT 9360]